jgi:hypothetical protein
MSIKDDPRAGEAANAILARMRRRTGRLGTTLAVLCLLVAALVIFAVCACKTAH